MAELVQEQAAVNTFRMHARLMLDDPAGDIPALSAQAIAPVTSILS